MNKASHFYLAKYITKHFLQDQPLLYRLAFIAGSIEPDLNPVTYLRGFKTVERFRGHNYLNVAPTIEHLTFELNYDGQYDFHTFYFLGKLAHYTTDAFTFPHNNTFKGRIRDHIWYERILQEHFKQFLEVSKYAHIKERDLQTIFSMIAARHEAYMKTPTSLDVDIAYTFNTVSLLVALYLEALAYVPAQMLAAQTV